ncbi:MAG: restriction endonuclease subunit S [Alphaproteobacteria bacterium]|nr:restriction endonuclease subunit S [Alphaproteobacteria bacterium]
MHKNWHEFILKDFAELNPKEQLSKGVVAKKVPMELLSPFCRNITKYEISEYSGGSKFRNGDTIMARITPCLENGKRARVSILDNNEIAFGSTEYIVFRARKDISDADFIYYLVCSDLIRQPAIKSMVGSSGRQRVQTDVIENLQLLLPPLPIQKKIAAVLSALDDKIELNNRINQNLEQQAELLFSKMVLVSSKKGTIGDYCSVKSGFAFKSSWWKNKGIRVIKIKNIEASGLNLQECSCVSKDKIKLAEDFIVSGGDLLIAMTGATIGKFAIVPKTDEILLVNQRVGKFFLGKDPVKKLPFIYCTLRQPGIYAEIINRGQGSAQPNISSSDIMSIPCVHPTACVINHFNEVCVPFFEKIITNKLENLRLSQLRDALLPKLMSGEADVSGVKID